MNIEELLLNSIKRKASDLHILPGSPPLSRIDGNLAPIKNYKPLSPQDTQTLIFSILTVEEQQRLLNEKVYETALTLPEIGNFRVSVFHQMNGLAAVFRIVPGKIPTLDELGLPSIIKRLLTLNYGLILVAGATGSGKSTTLAAMIDYINTNRACHIITIEDPIEFIHTNKRSVLNQLQVGRDTPNFSVALRASLRQDPDVILLGELRDLETMRLALIAAETGHLVLATIHASSAPIAVNRFADVFPTNERNKVRTMLAETLQAVICQTLVRKLAGGRIAVLELMLTTPAIRHYILQDMPAHMESTMQVSGDIGMTTLEQYLQELVRNAIISPTVATAVLENHQPFRDLYAKRE